MKAGFLDRIAERLDRIDPESLQSHLMRIAKEKGLMEAVFQAMQDGVLVLDGNGIINYLNRAAATFMGVETTSAVGQPVSEFLKEIDWDGILHLDAGEWSRVMTREVEMRVPRRRVLSFYVVPLATEATPEERGVLVMLRDITRDRQEAASTVESERVDAIKLLAAGVAHEIGNPLNALSIHLQLIDREIADLETEDRENIRELLGVARTEVNRLDLIITQFLRAIRPARPEFTRVRVDDLLKETLTLLKHEIENRGIRVSINRPARLPRIPLDMQQMKQAFFNVIKNAFQAMPDGGALTIALARAGNYLGISFHDTGPGIPAEASGRVFEPYYTTKPDGSGLGMMIVQRIVHDHGGAIELHSEPDEGTTVTILLPFAERRMRLLESKTTSPEESS